LNYLRATGIEVGLLLNFGLKPEFKRLIFDNPRKAISRNPRIAIADLLVADPGMTINTAILIVVLSVFICVHHMAGLNEVHPLLKIHGLTSTAESRRPVEGTV